MSVIDTLIIDRTQDDVDRIKYLKGQYNSGEITADEIAEWNAGLKGAYKASDLNRVGEACAYLYDIFTNNGYLVPGYVALGTSWTEADKPTVADFNQYISTILAIKAMLPVVQEVPDSMSRLNFEGANNIEKMLIEVDELLYNIISIFIYSGTVYSGMIWSQIGG